MGRKQPAYVTDNFLLPQKKLVNIDRSKCLQFEEMKAHVPFMGKNQKRRVVKMIAESSI